MTEVLLNLFWFLIFPGFVFSIFLGLTASWVVRKVSALVQWRVGPPVKQPFVDVMKLAGKEILVPEQAQHFLFTAAPLVGMAGMLVLTTMLWRISISGEAYIGDIIVAIYLMVLPSLALIMGSSASASGQASLGASREMKMVMSYELPLVLAIIVVIIKTAPVVGAGNQLSLAAISGQVPVLSVSGLLAFVVGLLCVQAKLGFVPFDIAEAETELAGGVLIEYSGALLAVWKMMQALMLVALPLFLVMVFLGGFGMSSPAAVAAGIGKYVLVLVLIILIKNTNPRVRIDQAMRFFWVYCGVALVAAVILASIGSYYEIGWL